MRSSTILVALLGASVNGYTLSPAQSSAIEAAASSYVASVAKQPLFTSIVSELATATGSALSGVLGIQSFISGATPTAGIAQLDGYIAELPSAASSFFASITAAEASIVNAMVATMTSATPTPTPTPTTSFSSQILESTTSASNTTSCTSTWSGYANTTTSGSAGVKTMTSVLLTTASGSTTGTAAPAKTSTGAAAGLKVGGMFVLGAAAAMAML